VNILRAQDCALQGNNIVPEIQIPEKSGIDSAPVYDLRTDPETVMLGTFVEVCISLSPMNHCFPFADSRYTECMQGLEIHLLLPAPASVHLFNLHCHPVTISHPIKSPPVRGWEAYLYW